MNLIWEPILAILLAITSFSVKSNPKAPNADAVLEHAVDEADVVVHVDWKSTVGDNYPTFQKLADDAQIKQVPELARALRDAVTQAEGGRAMFKNMVGFDLVSDLSSVTAFVKLPPPGGNQPEFLVVVRGNLAADLPSKIAKGMGGKEETIDGRIAAAMPDGTLIGFSKSGALVAGKREWAAPRLADAWKSPARARGSAWALIGATLDKKPFFLLASKPSADAIAHITAQLGTSDNFGKDLIANHTLAVFAASSTGMHWTYQAKDAAFAARVKQASEGLIELMRAGHLFPRGIAQLAAAALPSYAGQPGIDGAIKHKDKLLAAVDDLTGDGKFAATVKLSGSLVTVETKGKRISDVVPTGVLIGFGAIGFMAGRATVSAAPTPTIPARPPVRVTPAKPLAPKPPARGGATAPRKPAAAI